MLLDEKPKDDLFTLQGISLKIKTKNIFSPNCPNMRQIPKQAL